jgi:NAD(P)-dependent dehydrogenase (short-subunit alcohol dehydrogenase family)
MPINPMNFESKRILVTGGSSGIGRATAHLLSQLGAKVVLLARNEERLQHTLAGLAGSGHSKYVFDLSSSADEIPLLLKKIAQEQGPLAGLFHAAGISVTLPLRIVKEKHIDQVFAASIKAALMLTKGFCQASVSATGGSIVLMSSVYGVRGNRGLSVYSASKAAVDGAVRSLAVELAGKGIRLNSIIAGAVQTEMHAEIISKLNEAGIAEYQKKHLLGFGTSEDIANAACFLLSDASKWITGTSMVVDGGYCCV